MDGSLLYTFILDVKCKLIITDCVPEKYKNEWEKKKCCEFNIIIIIIKYIKLY